MSIVARSCAFGDFDVRMHENASSATFPQNQPAPELTTPNPNFKNPATSRFALQVRLKMLSRAYRDLTGYNGRFARMYCNPESI